MSVGSLPDSYYTSLQKFLAKAKNLEDLFEAVVNAPFQDKLHSTSLDLGIVVLLQVDAKDQMIDRVALSKTESANWAIKMTPIPFKQIRIPLSNRINILAKTVKQNKPFHTTDWKYIFTPAIAPEAARFNQAGAGIACSFTYPLTGARDGGAIIFSYYQPVELIGKKHQQFMAKYSQMVIDALNRVA